MPHIALSNLRPGANTDTEAGSFCTDGMTKQEQYVLLLPGHLHQQFCIQFQRKNKSLAPGWQDKHSEELQLWLLGLKAMRKSANFTE